MNESTNTSATVPSPLARLVVVGEDSFGEHRGLGISSIDFKVSPQDGSDLFTYPHDLDRHVTAYLQQVKGLK